MIRCALLRGDLSIDPASVLLAQEAGLLGPRAVPKRRADFLRGRWIAKRLLSELHPGTSWLDYAILPDDRGVPEPLDALLRPMPLSLSISHTTGLAASAAVELPARVGIDVEVLLAEPRLIVRDYFTEHEKEQLQGLGEEEFAQAVTAFWTAKEAVTKALGEGLRIPATHVQAREVPRLQRTGWSVLGLETRAQCPQGHRLTGFVRCELEAVVAVVVLAPEAWPVQPPRCLEFG